MPAKKTRVILGADHGGFRIKESLREWLEEQGIEFQDLGTYSPEPVDYPEYAEKVARQVAADPEGKNVGILVCGTGIGMSMAANKVPGVRAAVCHDEYTAQMAREHNDANLLCLGERVLPTGGQARKITQKFLDTEFSREERHARRVKKIDALDGKKGKAGKAKAAPKKAAVKKK